MEPGAKAPGFIMRNYLYNAARSAAVKGNFYDPLFFDLILQSDCNLLKAKGRKGLLEKVSRMVGKNLTVEEETCVNEYVAALKEIRDAND